MIDGVDLLDLPEGWVWTSVDEICLSLRDGTHNPPQRVVQGIPLLSARNIKQGYVDWNEDFSYISEDNFNAIAKNNPIRINDILLTIVGTIGRACVQKTTPRFTVQRSVAIVRVSIDHINPSYVQHLFNGPHFGNLLLRHARGTAQKGVYLGTIKELPIPLSPLPEQGHIVAKIEELFTKLDAGIELLKKVKAQLKQYQEAILKAAVEGKLTEQWRKEHPDSETASGLLDRISKKRELWIEDSIKAGNVEAKRLKRRLREHRFEIPKDRDIPDEWAWTSFLNACQSVVDCHNKTAPYTHVGIPLIRTTNIRDGKLLLEDVKYVSPKTYDYWSRRCPPEPGDILFTREAPMGEAALIPDGEKVCMGQRMMLLRVFKELLDAKYLLYAIMSPQFQKTLERGAVGTGVKHLRVGDVESLVFPLPPLDEQRHIVSAVEQRLTVIDEIDTEIEKNLQRAKRLRQSILGNAFCGKLVPQNPTDDPAEKLLENIKGEKVEMKAAEQAKRRSGGKANAKQMRLLRDGK